MKTRNWLALCLLALCPLTAHANHGPGTSGGGSATISGETLAQGKWDFSLRHDYTNFQDISRAGAERRALKAGGFDSISESHLTTGGASYGLTDDLQINASIGYYKGNGFIDAEADGGDVESGIADPEGLTDLQFNLKYRLLSGQPGNLSVVGGVIAPTGRDDVALDNGEVLEPSSQPGTGAWAYQFGVAYSRYLTSHVTIDASGLYTLRTEHDSFEVGDRLDLGVAVAYRLTDSVKQFPNVSVFGEVNAVWLGKDEADGAKNDNSGGWTVYLTPGVRVRVNENLAFTVAPSFPVIQELNGEQVETRFKLAATLELSI
ncbi:transporter [Humisphaera borealis]|uniref:Transporter n=1 Tax=Humisphaera borealis TaxID=2807512 RepID=A0A7M2WVE8_9BACT|nr:transporter [Humisphaera borealis]QOV89202.1 transporter [Humisphaera borealis]